MIFFYHPDHLGSSSYTTDANGEVTQHIEYFAFGETFLEEHSNTDRTPYLFNGKELDEETGLYYYGARYYDAKTSVWQSVDPPIFDSYWGNKSSELINEGVFNSSNLNVYSYTYQNPIKNTDYDGQWVPNKDGHLIAEKGDNAYSLAKYLKVRPQEAIKMVQKQGYTINSKGILNLKIGDEVTLSNHYTQSISDAKAGKGTFLTDSEMSKLTKGKYRLLMSDLTDKYNCWGSAIEGSMKNDAIEPGDGIGDGTIFDKHISTNYKDASGNFKFGETIVRFADSKGVTHGAVYYGTSKSGDVYLYTKNGWLAFPKIMKLNDLLKSIPTYGKPTGAKKGESGYYNKKP